MFVKICGLSTEEQVQVAVEAGANAIGFVFADSVRKVDPAHAATITRKVPDDIRKVAVMLRPSSEALSGVLDEFTPDVLQADADALIGLDVPVHIECWPVLREGNAVTATLIASLESATTFLFEGARSGRGETVDWVAAAKVAERGNMMLAGGLGVQNVAEAISTVRPFGVDVSSGVETAPGRKDPGLVREFISAAKAAGKNL